MPGQVDYVTASTQVGSGTSLKSTQLFVTGEENLEIDVTTIVSATLASLLPDSGFRVSYDQTHEDDQKTYFVKRFASRTAYNSSKHPRLIFKFDDSIQDDSQSLFLDSSGSLFLYNYSQQVLSNLLSGSTQITGSNCLTLRLTTEISGGIYQLSFSGSQHRYGNNLATGIYSASVYLPSTDSTIMAKIVASGSAKITPVWGSRDGTVGYLTGTSIYVYPALRGPSSQAPKSYIVTVPGIQSDYNTDEQIVVRLNIFDQSSPTIRLTRLPVEYSGVVLRDVHYQVRNNDSNVIEIPFDTTKNSTRASSDASGMYFSLDMSNLTPGSSYVVDALLVTHNGRQVHKSVSPVFRVNDVS